MRLRLRLCAAALVSALVVAGCGGDDDDAPLTAAEYRKQGNALCAKAISEAGKIPPPDSPDGLADYVEEVFDVGFEIGDEVEELDPPAELRALHAEAVRENADGRKDIDRLIGRVRLSDTPFRTLQSEFRKLAPEFEKGEQLNRRLGLDECNEVGPPSAQPGES